jgi:hypothetical protein
MFREGRKLKGGRLEKMIARAMEVVYQDEKSHYKKAAREAAQAVATKQDLARMKQAVHEISLQRVYMRNEMFKEPLTSAEIKSCIASHGGNRGWLSYQPQR